ncbi:helicase HerA-like domain-containing protein [Phycicoccus sp. M110.8]|uniref:helicase HerA-like domain-containing protein n=1 Tax=Phycicoccus sp. M110.8 TaxID=3075433 RepID=UPI0028FD5E6A|nr:helicase HerA-like domain-containing protein [Phycicoccus sp. M110.8]MDU0313961.1 helicase HerA-like domain-containing protein [Phycicoccus sp. M110.8]
MPSRTRVPSVTDTAAGKSESSTQLDEIRAGYAFEGGALLFGAAVVDGTAHPDAPVKIPLSTLNRHGLVAGATGTGKTKTLQLMAEQLSGQGVPVFLADIKGDLSGMATAGTSNDRITSRAADVGQQWVGTAYPTEFLSLGGIGKGIPIRATITSFGPTLLSKVLGLNDTQESSLGLVFHYADKNGLALLDVKDLREVVSFLTSDEGKADLKELGGLSSATAGVILRELVAFSDQGADAFFGEPEFDTRDLLRTAADGKGLVTCLELPAVQDRPALFSTFLMWLLADLFHDLPEIGDADKPKLVFFFDEAHLLFQDASKAFLTAIEQTVRLIRSKGVGVFFVTQSPKDVPSGVLAQLGNRVQHALRAYTPEDAKALKAAVSTYPHSAYDLEELLTSLGTGEAVVTVLSERGAPTPVAWTRMIAPQSLMAPSDDATVDALVAASPLAAKYATAVDRESAYEKLRARLEQAPAAPAAPAPQSAPAPAPAPRAPKPAKEEPGMVEQVVRSQAFRSMMRSAGTVIGREITRSLFGTARRSR